MKTLSLNEMELQSAGDIVAGFCVGIASGSAIYGIGVATNWWNPVGWVSAAFLVADVGCLGYAAGQLQ